MAIQLGNGFKPLVPDHYQLAETSDEKDRAAQRTADIQRQALASHERIANNSDVNENARFNASLGQKQQAMNTEQDNYLSAQDRQAQLDQQNQQQQQFENEQSTQKLGMAQSAQAQELGIAQSRNKREQNQESRTQQLFQQAQEQAKQEQDMKDKQVALANLGNHLSMIEHDNGVADVTSQKDNIEKLVGGFDKKYKKITAQSVNGKTQDRKSVV
jgi:hypothetical protein